jgi:hypothetical protein
MKIKRPIDANRPNRPNRNRSNICYLKGEAFNSGNGRSKEVFVAINTNAGPLGGGNQAQRRARHDGFIAMIPAVR